MSVENDQLGDLDKLIESCGKDYQTLFWIPCIYQTTIKTKALIEEMLESIQDFHDKEDAGGEGGVRRSILQNKKGGNKRRQQILGDVLDSDVAVTRVDVVLKSDSTKYLIMSVLKRHFLFSQLKDYELEDVIDSMQNYEAPEGEVIIAEGDPGDNFYILEEGTCEVTINGELIGNLSDATSFGDLALMYNCPRSATITAKTDSILWTLDRVFFRQAMVTSSSNQNFQLSQFLSKIKLFETLSIQSLNQLARSLMKKSYDDGEFIITQGEIGETFYIIATGNVKVTRMGDSGEETELVRLSEGEVFGELALIKKEPRAANIIAVGPTECFYLNKNDFSSMLGEIVDKLKDIAEFRVLRSCKVFNSLSENKLRTFRGSFYNHTMFKGQRLVCDPINIYIIMEGLIESASGSKYTSGACIGDLVRGADEIAGSLTAISDEVKLVYLERQALKDQISIQEEEKSTQGSIAAATSIRRGSVFGSQAVSLDTGRSGSMICGDDQGKSLKDLERSKSKRRQTATSRRESVASMIITQMDTLEIVRPLGSGTFGNVYLSKHRVTGKYIALKCLDKAALVNGSQQQYVRREIIALQTFNHPFIGSYYGIITTPRKIFFCLEFITGGELWSLMYGSGEGEESPVAGPYGGIRLDTVILYSACVAVALEHIHDQGYSYRDLKPENLLISHNGYVKLVDMGFAKAVPFVNSKSGQVLYRTFTLCGTPDYMAPEVVLTQGHDKSADYWAFGVLIYEMLCGHTPFEGRNQQRTFEKIVHSQKYLQFQPGFDPHCKSFIRKLLHPNPSLRLGALQNGFGDIKDHAFFTTNALKWDDLLSQKITMPFIPPQYTPSTADKSDVEMIDLDFEKTVQVKNNYAEYFDNLTSVDVTDD